MSVEEDIRPPGLPLHIIVLVQSLNRLLSGVAYSIYPYPKVPNCLVLYILPSGPFLSVASSAGFRRWWCRGYHATFGF
jgi:hypothetical protein